MDGTRIGRGSLARGLAVGQGTFFIAGGLWPMVHLRSLEAVTGRKLQGRLVKTVGALFAVAGAALAMAGRRRSPLDPDASRAAVG